MSNSKPLQLELKRSRPFDSLQQEGLLAVIRASDQLQNRLGRLFREHQLTSSQYNVLRILRGEKEPLPILEVASRTVQVVPAITGLVDRLESQGLVKRRRCEKDRRVVFIEITKNGLEILRRLDEPIARMEQHLLRHVKKAELKMLILLLEKVRAGCSGDE